MQLTRYIAPLDFRAVSTYLSLVLQLLGVFLAPSFFVALISQEFLLSGLMGGLGLAAYLVGRIGAAFPRSELELREALVVTALAYLVFAILGGLIFLPHAPFIDGFFEAMSGFTTTGLTTFSPETLPKSLLFFRASAQWMGGAGIIVITLVILSGPGRAAFRLYAAEFGGENLVGSVVATARIVLKVYLILTVLCFLALLAAGMSLFDGLLHALTTISTGGFSPHSESVGHFSSPFAQVVVAFFMVLGAVSFPLFYLARLEGPKRLFRDLQLHYLLVIILLGTIVFLGVLGWHPGTILPSLFQAVSAATGTGFSTVDISSWPESNRLLAIVFMLIGGSTGSTTGGIKLLRLIILVHLVGWLLSRALLPKEATLALKYGPIVVSDVELKEIFGFVALFLAVFVFSGLLLTMGGFNGSDAFFESASAIGTVGLSSGITSMELTAWAKLLLIFEMWVGRLEILPALVVLYPGTWKWRRRAP